MPRVCAVCGRKFEENVTRCPDDGSPTLVYAPEDDLIGKTIDARFTVKDLLGKGGMGAVYRAHQHSMDRDVALCIRTSICRNGHGRKYEPGGRGRQTVFYEKGRGRLVNVR